MAEGLRIGREEARKASEEARKAREEAQKGREVGIRALLITSFELGASDDIVRKKLMELFHLTEEEARERISRYRESV